MTIILQIDYPIFPSASYTLYEFEYRNHVRHIDRSQGTGLASSFH